MRTLAVLCLSVPLAAQLQVLSVGETSPTALGSTLSLGTVALGDSAQYRFRAVNGGIAPLLIQTISVGGAGFSLVSPSIPLTLAPAQSHDFLIRFSPPAAGSYSAILTVNSFSSVLRATGVAGPSFFVVSDSGNVEISTGSVQLSGVQGDVITLRMAIGNPHSSHLTVDRVSLSGPGFSLIDPPLQPMTLSPGENRPLTVRFSAPDEGEYVGQLVAGPRQLLLRAVVARPISAPPAISVSEVIPRNGQQMKVRLQLPQPALGAASGVLRASFQGPVDDAAIAFSNGRREIGFEFEKGSQSARFNGAPDVVLQTGTTAGVLRLDAIANSWASSESYVFQPSAVVVDAASARRQGASLEIDIAGFDNTRATGSLNFRFFDRSGNALGGPVTVEASEPFRSYFQQSSLGGVFRLRAIFPVSGDATMVGSVLVEVANAVGRTDLQRLTFP